MTTPEHAADRTRLMARAIGPFFTIAARASDMKVLVDRFEADPMWPWVLGAMLLIGGCIPPRSSCRCSGGFERSAR